MKYDELKFVFLVHWMLMSSSWSEGPFGGVHLVGAGLFIWITLFKSKEFSRKSNKSLKKVIFWLKIGITIFHNFLFDTNIEHII
jgi:hypothetical protein